MGTRGPREVDEEKKTPLAMTKGARLLVARSDRVQPATQGISDGRAYEKRKNPTLYSEHINKSPMQTCGKAVTVATKNKPGCHPRGVLALAIAATT